MTLYGKHINKYYIKYGIFLLIGILALIVVDWIQLYIPEYLGQIVEILDNNGDLNQIGFIALKAFGVAVGMFLGRMLWRFSIFYAGMNTQADIRQEMFNKAEKLSRDYYHSNKIGTIMAWFTNDLDDIEECFGWGTVMLVDAIFLSVCVIIKMFNLDLLLSIFTMIPIVLIVVWGALVEGFMAKKWSQRQEAFDKLYDFSQENFTGIRVIKAFVKENQEIHTFAKIARKNHDVNIGFSKISVLFDVIIQIIIALIFALLLGGGGYFVYCAFNGIKPLGFDTQLSASKLVTFTGYFDTLVWPMIALGQIVTMTARGKSALRRISAFLDAPEDIKNPENAIVLNDVKGKITFKNFTFEYKEAYKPTLKGISLEIQPGEKVGIVGKIGSGKSTLAQILLYFYNLNADQVFIDDNDLSKCDVQSIRDSIAYVPQDNFLFSDTIENNIEFSKASPNLEEAIEAAKFAAVDDNVQDFKEKYDTMTGERGVTLSGGQKQRISIARAYIKKSPIMILDDSVSAVDTKTEEYIMNNILELRKGLTTLVVASRVSTVHKLDKVIVMNAGEIEAFDTPANLLKISPTFKKMVALQKLEAEEGGIK